MNTGAPTVPVAVMVWLWVPSAFNVPVTAELFMVPVTADVAFARVPKACRWEEPTPDVTAPPVNVGCVKTPAAMAGTPAGHEIVGCVNTPAAIVGTPAGQDIAPGVTTEVPFVPAGV